MNIFKVDLEEVRSPYFDAKSLVRLLKEQECCLSTNFVESRRPISYEKKSMTWISFQEEFLNAHEASLASTTPLPPPLSWCCLSTNFIELSRSVPMTWISLQGGLLNSHESISAQASGSGLTEELALTWNLFLLIHRFFIVVVIGVVIANSQKNQQIYHLKKFVELKDQVLSSFQQKLGSPCEHVNNSKENSSVAIDNSSAKGQELHLDGTSASKKIRFVDCGCCHCEEHYATFNELMEGASITRHSSGNEMLQCKMPLMRENPIYNMDDTASTSFSAVNNSLQLPHMMDNPIYLLDNITSSLSSVRDNSPVINNNEVLQCKMPLMRDNPIYDMDDTASASFSAVNSSVQLPHMMDNPIYLLDNITSSLSSVRGNSPVINNEVLQCKMPLMRDNPIYDMDDTTSASFSVVNNSVQLPHMMDNPIYLLDNITSSLSSARDNSPVINNNEILQCKMPLMRDNPIYDMGDTTSPSSSAVNNNAQLPHMMDNPIYLLDNITSSLSFVRDSSPVINNNEVLQCKMPLMRDNPIYDMDDTISSSSSTVNNSAQLPHMMDNLIYLLDNIISSLSSVRDSSPVIYFFLSIQELA